MTNFKIVARLFKYSKGFRKSYILALIINAFTMIRFSFLIGLSIQYVTDSAIAGDWEKLKKALIFSTAAFLVNGVLYFLEGYLMLTRVSKMTGELEKDLLERVIHLPAEYLSAHHSGDLQSRLTSDLELASESISFSLVDPINFGALGLVNLALIAAISWEMALICFGLVVAVIFINAVFMKPIQASSKKIQGFIASATERYLDTIRGIPIIKIFNLQQWIYNHYDRESKNVLSWQSRLNKITASQRAFNDFINLLCTFGIIAVGSFFLAKGRITHGSLLAITRYSSTLVFAFTGFGLVLADVTKSLEGARRVLEVLDIPIEEEKCLEKSQIISESVLEFKDVSFSYNDEKLVIKDFTEKIQKGEIIALVGPSGTGKTTIMKIIMGLYPLPKEYGKIFLFGRDINEYTLDERRKFMTYVPQNNYLFTGTIIENISLGRVGATKAEIIKAAKAAHAHDFISKLPFGYDSQVGENGGLLSGGERQRIAIARALLKDAPILLLDEPTASLDSASEQEIQRALDNLIQGKTVIVAAHRLSTIKDSDRIIVLEDGKVVEKSTHEELMKLNSRYAKYYKLLYS